MTFSWDVFLFLFPLLNTCIVQREEVEAPETGQYVVLNIV